MPAIQAVASIYQVGRYVVSGKRKLGEEGGSGVDLLAGGSNIGRCKNVTV